MIWYVIVHFCCWIWGMSVVYPATLLMAIISILETVAEVALVISFIVEAYNSGYRIKFNGWKPVIYINERERKRCWQR